MMALRWHGRGDVRLDEVDPPPHPGPGQIQVAVRACGICGTDVEEWREGPVLVPAGAPHPLSGQQAPVTLGHELAGEVVALGPGAAAQVGDMVAVDGLLSCGLCRECRRGAPNRCPHFGQVGLTSDGGLQPLVNVPAASSIVMPRGAAPEAGALAEALSVAVRALRQARLSPGDAVAVVGCGPVGFSHVCGEDFAGALAMISSGAIRWDGMITWIPLVRALQDGLLALDRQPHRYLKIMITPEAA